MSEKDIDNFDNDKDNKSKSEKELPKTKQEYSKKIGNYVLLCEIGTGTFSKVAKAFHIITDQEVAVKILEKEKIKDEIDIERILREIEILKKVIHPNICQLYETYSTVHNFYIMMEHITGGDLFDYITNNNYLSENKSCKLFRQLISVIEYLNELGISHRDIKPENILLDDEQENLKLIDFGLSNYFSESKLLKSSCGSPCYASPEMLSGMPYLGLTTDLWSSGIVLYSMLVGSLPFDDQELYELYKQIKLGKFYLPSTLSLEAIDLLKRILNVDPDKRISLEGIKNHQWFKMDGYPLYKGIDLTKEKLGYNQQAIDYVMNNYFSIENELEPIPKNEFIEMVRNYCCNKYTATYYLTKKYILEIDDKDSIFKKGEPEEKEKGETKEEKAEKNINLKYDKKICKKNARDNNIKSEESALKEINDKINVKNNYKSYIIKNDINLEIKRNVSSNKNDENPKQKRKNEKGYIADDDIEKKGVLLTEIDDESNEKKINKELFKNDIKNKDKLNSAKKKSKNERKKNYKKNELYLNNIKNTNLNPNFRGSLEIKQKKFAKNLLLKGQKTKENITSNNVNNHSNNNSYIIKTWGNNSINHISKNNKITFIHSGNNQKNNLNYNNYFSYNINANNNNKNVNKKKNHENNSSVNSHNKVHRQTSQKKNDKEKDKEKNKEKERNKEKKNDGNNHSYNNNNNANGFKNKYSLTSSKEKENNFNFYLINNYINQNEIKNNKNSSNLSNYHFGKVQNIMKPDDCDSNINFSQYYFIKSRKCNILKTIDLPGSYTSRYNTEANIKKLHNSSIKQYNKIKVNLKTDSNKFRTNYSPKFSHNKKDNIRIKTNSLNKDFNNISNSVRKKNSSIKIKNIIINSDNNSNILSNTSVKKDNSNKNINSNTNIKSTSSKIDYKKYIKNESKPITNNKITFNQSGNIISQNLKNISMKSKYTKKIPRKDSTNSSKVKNSNAAKDLKEHILSNINNNQNIIYRNNDIYNKKKVINCCTTKNHNKNYKFKELFPIEEGNKIFDIKCHFNTKRLKNKILLLNEGYLTNKCNSPKEAKEFYSFNDSGNSSVYHSVSNIINNKKVKKDNKMKQNFSNIYNRKKNLIIKTDNNLSGEKGGSPQFTDKKIKIPTDNNFKDNHLNEKVHVMI